MNRPFLSHIELCLLYPMKSPQAPHRTAVVHMREEWSCVFCFFFYKVRWESQRQRLKDPFSTGVTAPMLVGACVQIFVMIIFLVDSNAIASKKKNQQLLLFCHLYNDCAIYRLFPIQDLLPPRQPGFLVFYFLFQHNIFPTVLRSGLCSTKRPSLK